MTGPLDLDHFSGKRIFTALANEKIAREILAMSTGLVYNNEEIKKTDADKDYILKQAGSCSIVKNNKSQLFIVTNKHVVSDRWAFLYGHDQKFRDNKEKEVTKSYVKKYTAILSGCGMAFAIPMNKLVAMGDDFAVFKIDKDNMQDLCKQMAPKLKCKYTEVPNKFFEMSGIIKEPQLLVNTVRQSSDRTIEECKKVVGLRKVIINYQENKQLFEILGYSTPGLSGSPL